MRGSCCGATWLDERGPAVARVPLPPALSSALCQRPTNERPALERERAELPAHVANYERELDATPPENREIQRVQKRLAEIQARLAVPPRG